MTNSIILILGKKGSGKTEFAKKAISNFSNVIIIDVLNEYEDGTVIYNVTDFIRFIKEHSNKDYRIILKELDDEKINQYFYLISSLRNITIFAEEVDYYYPNSNPNLNFVHLIKYGRHYGINIVGITRRPFECSNFLRSQADLVVSFRQHEPRDIDWLKKRDKEFADVDKLPDYEFIATGDIDLLKTYWNIEYKKINFLKTDEIEPEKEVENKEEKA